MSQQQVSLVDLIRGDCTELLVRYLQGALNEKSVVAVLPASTSVNERDFLLLLWALSAEVGDALRYLVEKSKHVIPSRERVERETKGSGTLLARKSTLLQMRSGDPSRFVATVSQPTMSGGATQCLAWFVDLVDRAIQRFPNVYHGPWKRQVGERTAEIGRARSIPGISDCFKLGLHRTPPSRSSLRAAASLRNPLYQGVLAQIRKWETVSRSSLSSDGVLVHSALTEMETWRQMELLGALLAVSALEEVSAERHLHFQTNLEALTGQSNIIARCGPYTLRWQTYMPKLAVSRTARHEFLSGEMLPRLGLGSGTDRADIVVEDASEKKVSVGESKYFGREENSVPQLSGAIEQIVKYADQVAADDNETKKLVSRCFVFLPTSAAVEAAASKADGTNDLPVIVPYNSPMQTIRFRRWAERVLDLHA